MVRRHYCNGNEEGRAGFRYGRYQEQPENHIMKKSVKGRKMKNYVLGRSTQPGGDQRSF